MDSYFTPSSSSFTRWLVAFAGSLVLWAIAYAHAPAPAWQLGLQSAKTLSSQAASLASSSPASLRRFATILASSPDEAAVLSRLAAQATEPVAQATASHPGTGPRKAAALGHLLAE